MKLLQINTTLNTGSTGRIAEQIGKCAIDAGWQSYIAYGRGDRPSESNTIKIGAKMDQAVHLLGSRLLDKHGLFSRVSTRAFITKIESIQPDIIHLHNIHGYYLHYQLLFDFLQKYDKPVIWTLHDCWSFTGHCAFYMGVNCEKWKKKCHDCPLTSKYPASFGLDRSEKNFDDKMKAFQSVSNITIVTPSEWLQREVASSFLNVFPSECINNGLDTTVFKDMQTSDEIRKKYNLGNKKIILGVANIWDKRKGLEDFIQLSDVIGKEYQIVLVGIRKNQIQALPSHVIGIERTENTTDLAALYAAADVFVNPTYSDNFPTTNIEALSCGTPVITYDTGGSPEAVDSNTGSVIKQGGIFEIAEAIKFWTSKVKETTAKSCQNRAYSYFNKDIQINKYLDLYQKVSMK